jgi:hypothetical protein
VAGGPVERGLFGRSCEDDASLVNGNSICEHDLPWLTQLLQKPQSFSLHCSQRQKHSFAQAEQRAQNIPISSLFFGSYAVSVFRPSAPPGRCWGGTYRWAVNTWGGDIACGLSLRLRIFSHLTQAAYPNPNQCLQPNDAL